MRSDFLTGLREDLSIKKWEVASENYFVIQAKLFQGTNNHAFDKSKLVKLKKLSRRVKFNRITKMQEIEMN